MTWLLWRQHRLQLALAAAALGLFALPVLVTGAHLRTAWTACRASTSCNGSGLLDGYGAMNVAVDVTVAVPLVIGLFWGVTLLGREFETGTAGFVWTQSVTRRHWFRTKAVSLLAFAAAAGAGISGLVTWWSTVHNSAVESRFAGLQFDIQGIVPIGYSLFAAGLGLAAGVFWRRVMPAMVTTLVGFAAVRFLVELYWRPHFATPVVRLDSLNGPLDRPAGSWPMGDDLVLHGRVIGGAVRVPSTCVGADSRDAMSTCMDAAGYQVRSTYQPAGRYWTFQWIEFGIFVALTALLVGAAMVVLRRRDV